MTPSPCLTSARTPRCPRAGALLGLAVPGFARVGDGRQFVAAITLWDGSHTLHDVWFTDAGAAEDWVARHWFARAVVNDPDQAPVEPRYCGSVFRNEAPSGVGAVRLPAEVAEAVTGRRAGPRYVIDLYEAAHGDVGYVTSIALDPKLKPVPPSRAGALLSADPLDVIDRADLAFDTDAKGGRRAARVVAVGAGLPPVQPADTAGVVLAPAGGPTVGLMALRRFGLGDGSGALVAMGPAVAVGPAPEDDAPLAALALATLITSLATRGTREGGWPEGLAGLHRAAPHVASAALRFGSTVSLEALARLGDEPDPLASVLEVSGLGRARRTEAAIDGPIGIARLLTLVEAEGPSFVEALGRAGLQLPIGLTGARAGLARTIAVAMADTGFAGRLAAAAAHAEREGVAADAEQLRAPLSRVSGEVMRWDDAFEIMGTLDAWEAARRRQEAADQRAFERILGRPPPPPDPDHDPRAPLDLEALKADVKGMIARLPDRFVETDKRAALVDAVEAYGEDPARLRWAHGALGRLVMAMAAPSAAALMVERLETWAGVGDFAARMTGARERGGAEDPAGISAVTRLMARLPMTATADVDAAWTGTDRSALETVRAELAAEITTFGLAGGGATGLAGAAQPSANALMAYAQLLLAHRVTRQVDALAARVDAALAGLETAGDPVLGAVARERQALGWLRHTVPDGLGRLLHTAHRLREAALRAPATATAVADFAFDFTPPPGPKTGVPARPEVAT